jgi:hypothetical protein
MSKSNKPLDEVFLTFQVIPRLKEGNNYEVVKIRKRMGGEVFSSFEQAILESLDEKKKQHQSDVASQTNATENKSKLLVDATVAEQAIRYPTDISLLNKALSRNNLIHNISTI